MKIGTHVSAAGVISLVFERAAKLAADCCQFFISPPQQWAQTQHNDEEIGQFIQKQSEFKIAPNFIHGSYLINLGATSPEHLQKSVDWLIYAQKTASRLGVEGVVFHLGSHKKAGFETVFKQVVGSIRKILAQYTGSAKLILETSAGAGGNIGGTFAELGQILKTVSDSRLKVCLDTCHVFASGYELRNEAGVSKMIADFDQEIGLKNLVAVHANDSRFDIGLGKDRHENIGQGFIGTAGFKILLNSKEFNQLPFILEVPGFEKNGPDIKNIEILRSLVDSADFK